MGLLLFGCSALTPSANAFYNPQPGRWLNRDPINELGFKVLTQNWQDIDLEEEKSLYVFVPNNAVNFYDPLGNCFCLLVLPGKAWDFSWGQLKTSAVGG